MTRREKSLTKSLAAWAFLGLRDPHLAQAAESFAEAAGGQKPALAEMEKQKYFGLPRVFLKQTQDSEGNPQFPFSFQD